MSTDHIADDLRSLAVPMADLYEDPANARTHSDRNLSAITGSLKRFGQRKPIVAAPDGRIIAGNGTFRAATLMGWTHLAVTRFDGDAADLVAYAIADNRSADLASWDYEVLGKLLANLPEDLQAAAGWDDEELNNLLSADWKAPDVRDLDPTNEPESVSLTFSGENLARLRRVLGMEDPTAEAVLDALGA